MLSRPLIHIFDLDGCTINDEWRLPMIDWKNREFKKYHDNIPNDTHYLLPGYKLLRYAMERIKRGHHDKIIFSTARPETHYDHTIDQINSMLHVNRGDFHLYMRSEKEEGVPSADLKMRNLNKIIAAFTGIPDCDIFAYDDHPDVVRAYQKRGINAWLVNRKFVVYGGHNNALEAIRKGHVKQRFEVVHHKEDNQHSIGFVLGVGLTAIPHVIARLMDDLIGDQNERTVTHDSLVLDAPRARPELATEQAKPVTEDINFDHLQIGYDVAGGADKTAISHIHVNVIESGKNLFTPADPKPRQTADQILKAAAETFAERNAQYKDNALVVADVMKALFPDGVRLDSPEDYHFWHLFELLIVKLTRFTNSDLRHVDSIHDLMVYAAMIEPLVESHNIEIGEVK